MPENFERIEILERISSLGDDIAKAQEYLDTGAHEHWHGFRPMFKDKAKDGKLLPPHKDWVKNVFLPERERALKKAERLLDKFE